MKTVLFMVMAVSCSFGCNTQPVESSPASQKAEKADTDSGATAAAASTSSTTPPTTPEAYQGLNKEALLEKSADLEKQIQTIIEKVPPQVSKEEVWGWIGGFIALWSVIYMAVLNRLKMEAMKRINDAEEGIKLLEGEILSLE